MCMCGLEYQYNSSVAINLNVLFRPSAGFVFKQIHVWDVKRWLAASGRALFTFQLRSCWILMRGVLCQENVGFTSRKLVCQMRNVTGPPSSSHSGRSARTTWRVGSLWTLCHPSRWTTSSWWWTAWILRSTGQPGRCALSASPKSWACCGYSASPDSSATSTSGRRWETESRVKGKEMFVWKK